MNDLQVSASRKFKVLLIFLVGIAFPFSALSASNKTILDYTYLDATLAGPKLSSPKSVFHAWEISDLEAEKILQSWKSEPITIAWTRIQLDRIVKHKISPSRSARGLALMHVAMYDAFLIAETRHLDPKLVVSMAAAQVLGYLYNAEERAFDRIAFSLAAKMSNTTPEKLSETQLRDLQLGQLVGEHVVRYGDTDGAQRGWNGVRLQWYGENRYYGPGAWEPTPPYFYYPPDEPFAPTWRPWVLNSASEFRPVPPDYGSEKHVKDLREVIAINATLTKEQKDSAIFWVDGHGSITPAGHWNKIAADETLKAHFNDEKTAKLFALLNVTLADTFIAAWETKYHYWTIRPVTAARYLLGVDLRPYILTPPFPSYVSGHAAFSGAAAKVLSDFFTGNAEQLTKMGEDAAFSRLLGGIHYRHDNDDGLVLGRKVAEKVLKKYGL